MLVEKPLLSRVYDAIIAFQSRTRTRPAVLLMSDSTWMALRYEMHADDFRVRDGSVPTTIMGLTVGVLPPPFDGDHLSVHGDG
jgi:hypothetical protein